MSPGLGREHPDERPSQAAEESLQLRRSLGLDLADAHRLLPRFVAYLDSISAPTVTVEAPVAWSQVRVWTRRAAPRCGG